MDIKGHSAIVTGGASGLGAATARALAAAGAKVAIFDVNAKAASEVAIDISGIAVTCDVSDSASAEAAVKKAAADHGPARILVNCAGVGPAKRIVGRDGPMPLADYERVIKINLIGTFNMLRLVGAAMQPLPALADGERGVIVNTASVAAFEGQIGQAAYSSSKGGVAALTMPAAREFAQFGVRVLAIAPAYSARRCCTRYRRRRRTRLAPRCRFPSAWEILTNMPRWCCIASATAISTAKSSGSTARCAWRRVDRTMSASDIIDLYERHAREWANDRARQSGFFEKSWLDRFLGLMPAGVTILDLGCGPGKPMAAYLIAQGFAVYGLDSSPTMVALARADFPDETWMIGDMRAISLAKRFGGILAWDSFFHLSFADQRRMFPVFRNHAAAGAPLLFTSGPGYGEAIGLLCGEPLYHASLDPAEYRSLLTTNDFTVVAERMDDRECGGHSIWLARAGEGH